MILGEAKKPLRVLIVDDDEGFRTAVSYSFKRLGYEVSTAASGNEAFDKIKASPVDVVISDICMPNGTGVDLLNHLKGIRPDIPIVLLVTGYSELSTEDAYAKGAEALIGKPFNIKILQDTIARLLTPPESRWKLPVDHIDTEFKVALRFRDLSEATEAKIVGLGRGGIMVSGISKFYPNIGDTVHFCINFGPDGDSSLDGTGMVKWIRARTKEKDSVSCGIEFTFLGEQDRQKIISMIEAKKPKAFIPNS